MTSQTVLKVIDQIKENRVRFEAFCRSLSDEQLARPVPENTWNVKDFIAHLSTLDPMLEHWFTGVANGEPDAGTRTPDGQLLELDDWNEQVVVERRSWTLDQLFDEAGENRAKLIEAMLRLEDEHIDRITHFSGDNKRPPVDIPLKLFIRGWARHDAIHVGDMLKALPERADDPDLVAWLDDPAVKWYQNAMAGPSPRLSSE